ncbi:uncharacterized protein EI97DRAFT_437087 [Westerdykella ornata]|uniref:Proteophosphoglycan 5 n=1 Tax=Westerdykella ornata TaxID=318751 RepID=A0A6A6J7W7_WESOR|nr:uncharacterized protein EI97DRAFT_437087 [Westerdykella ornata]KAF2272327.1 hypothetical protein EI97DRAFT_437087 [Westerdykella ornata]
MAPTDQPHPSIEESHAAPQAVSSTSKRRAPQRRQRGNRANNPRSPPHGARPIPIAGAPDSTITDTDSAPLSGEDVSIPTAQRRSKKHIRARSSADRAAPVTDVPEGSSLTDTERGSSHATSHAVATPSRTQAAYAGPTFHASPAPSALPVPKFLSKSVPAKVAACIPEPFLGNSEAASPPSPSPAYNPSHHQAANPTLSLLFKADRDERARQNGHAPLSGAFLDSPEQSASRSGNLRSNQDSQMTMNALFPIELDGEGQTQSLSQFSQNAGAHCSVTTPSRMPQGARAVPAADPQSFKDPAVQDLLNRLSLSGQEPVNPSSSHVSAHVPSEPSSRHHTPSPFQDRRSPIRSASGPTTPAPSTNELQSPFHYGNKNLSPLFKAAKADGLRRNSGLRTELTPGIPAGPEQSPFQSRGASRPSMGSTASNSFDLAQHHRRPMQGQQSVGVSNGRIPQTPIKHGYTGRSGSSSQSNNPPSTARSPAAMNKPSAANPFIPSSVRARQFSTPPKGTGSEAPRASTPKASVMAAPSTSASETAAWQTDAQQHSAVDELKRMLKLDGA